MNRLKATETEEQQALIEWRDYSLGKYPELQLLYAIPNGGDRHPGTAARLKREGVLKGIPDLMLPVARGLFHGLYIEMKTETGKPSKEQKEIIPLLQEQRYCVIVCHGCQAAIDTLIWYLSLGTYGTPVTATLANLICTDSIYKIPKRGSCYGKQSAAPGVHKKHTEGQAPPMPKMR